MRRLRGDLDKCDVRYCRNDATIIYYGKRVCDFCFGRHCDGKLDLKQEFGVK